jgi:hypothetical protein
MNPSLLTDPTGGPGSFSDGYKMDAQKNVPQALYTLTHELGHITDFQNRDSEGGNVNHVGTHFGEIDFHRSQKENLSGYGKSKLLEGYAEAFAQHHLGNHRDSSMQASPTPARQGHRLSAEAYAKRYGWAMEAKRDDQIAADAARERLVGDVVSIRGQANSKVTIVGIYGGKARVQNGFQSGLEGEWLPLNKLVLYGADTGRESPMGGRPAPGTASTGASIRRR